MPKISQLPDATLPLTGEECVVLNQSSIGLSGSVTFTVKTAIANLSGGSPAFHGVSTLLTRYTTVTDDADRVPFDGVQFDTDGFFNPAIPTLLTAPFTGFYLVVWSYQWLIAAGGAYELNTFIDSPSAQFVGNENSVEDLSSTGYFGLSSYLDYFSAGDTITLAARNLPSDAIDGYFAVQMSYLGGTPPPPPPPPSTLDALIADSSTTISITGSDALLWE